LAGGTTIEMAIPRPVGQPSYNQAEGTGYGLIWTLARKLRWP